MKKIFNDPVHGFISIRHQIILDILDHPYFQRLRRITQLGLTNYVYPGAHHTRFHHALGAYHLMKTAIYSLRDKHVEITEEEEVAACIGILLHDIGHGPFSHTLENTIIKGVHHEDISLILMNALNEEMEGKLTLAIQIFKGEYHKRFLHNLISGQLDVDRMDYLARDSFFTGVNEGVISHDRILKMLDVVDNELVVEEKGIYSIEKFLISRRMMYWQVYLHKTVLCVEMMLIKTMERAKSLASKGIELPCSPSLRYFLYNKVDKKEFESDVEILSKFTSLDDYDVFSALKLWVHHEDMILSNLSKNILDRELYKVSTTEMDEGSKKEMKSKLMSKYNCTEEETIYMLFDLEVGVSIYDTEKEKIQILKKDNVIYDLEDVSELLNLHELSVPIKKKYLFQKNII
jgi:uncharacterized protein